VDKKLAGLLGAAAALTTMTAAQAAPVQAAKSYRDLLDPIPNALPLLKADDARLATAPANTRTRLAQVSVQIGHPHHHHHHVVRIGHHHHHHHVRVRVHDHD
jgi:hypothetical protein